MNERPWRLRPRIVLIACGFAAASLLLAFTATRRFLHSRIELALPADRAARLAHDFDIAFLAVAVIAIVATATLALLLSDTAVRMLARLARHANERRHHQGAKPRGSRIVELHAVENAIDRLATELEGEADRVRSERDEAGVLVESVSEGILLVDGAGRVMEANAAARAVLGLPAACRGRLLISMVRNPQLRALLERVRTEPMLRDEVEFDDRRLLVQARPAAGRDASASDARIVLTIVDLTELRRLESVRRDFVANVSHELKTPLTSIQGYVETLLSDALPPETERQFLEVVRTNAQRLRSIVDDLLDLSRLESGGWRPAPEVVDVGAVVDAAWAECRPRAERKDIRFERPNVDTTVRADAGALRQILLNLFDNAIRHTPAGGTIRVRIAASGEGTDQPRQHAAVSGGTTDEAASVIAPPKPHLVTIAIEDTGCGIPSEALPRIFERFFRVDPARSRAEGGTGLGLSIVKHLTEAMGGDVSAESTLGRGTTIRVRLPST